MLIKKLNKLKNDFYKVFKNSKYLLKKLIVLLCKLEYINIIYCFVIIKRNKVI